jgi:hypothetical protein
MFSRLALLELLYPVLWDRSCLVDLIMDIDHPVLLPLSSEELKAKQEEDRVAGKTFVRGSMHLHMMMMNRSSLLKSQGEADMAAPAAAAATATAPSEASSAAALAGQESTGPPPEQPGTLPLGFSPSEL